MGFLQLERVRMVFRTGNIFVVKVLELTSVANHNVGKIIHSSYFELDLNIFGKVIFGILSNQ